MKRRRLLSIVLSLCLLFGVCTGSVLSAAAVEGDGAEEIVSYPGSEKFDQLWVGDYVMFPQGRTGLDYKVELTVLSGDCVEIQQDASMGIDHCPAFFCKSAGTAQVKAVLKALSGSALNEQTYTLTVSERPAEMTVSHNLPASAAYKVGEEFSYVTKIENANFDAYHIGPAYSFPEDYDTSLYGIEIPVFATYWDMIAIGGAFEGGIHLGCEGTRDFRFFTTSFIAARPGTVVLDPFCGSANLDKFVLPSIGAASTITIEEPVITDNAPKSVKAGDSITLSTELTNTAFENRKAAYYEDGANFEAPPFANDDYLAYKPSVTVIEGEELVSQSNRDYSNTLSSEETLTFLKPGAVKLLVSYNQIDVYKFWPNLDESERVELYTPVKEITIEVLGEGSEPVTGGPDVTINTEPGVTIEDGSAFPEDTVVTVKAEKSGKLFEQAKTALKNLFEKFNAFSIEAIRNGTKVQPNGKVKVVFDIPKEFSSNVAVYYIDDNGKAEKIKTTVDAKSRTASVELEHFSLYALVDEGTKVPKVGENMPLGWLLLAAGIGLGGAVLAVFLKKKGKAE